MSTDWKNTSYNSILLIVGLQDAPVQISQYTQAAEIISDVVIEYHDLSGSATETQFSPSKFWSSLCCYLVVKQTKN